MNSIEQGLDVYRNELKAYLLETDRIKRSYGWQPGETFDQINLSNHHYNWCVQNTATLRGMEKILGLSKEEVDEFEQNIIKELNHD